MTTRKKGKMLALLAIPFVMVMILPIMSSCAPVLEFGDLTISTGLDAKTGAPLGAGTVFDFDTPMLYVVMEASGVDADDINSFVLKNGKGEIIIDRSDKYLSGEDGPVQGYFYMELTVEENKEYMLYPGEYIAEFYHKGELKDTQEFNITVPESKVLEVVLSSQVDEQTMAPIAVTDEFLDTDTFFAVAKLNFGIIGDYYEVNWFYEGDELINTTRLEMDENFYEENFISFKLFRDIPWPAGNYSVDLYQNGKLVGKYNFSVISTQVEEEIVQETDDPFAEGNHYISEEYGFGFALPDGWTVYDGISEGDLSVEIVYEQQENVFLSYSFYVGEEGDVIEPEDYDETSRQYVLGVFGGEDTFTLIDENSGEYMTTNDVLFYDNSYLLEGPDGNEWTIIINYFQGNNRTYIMLTMAMADFYEMGEPVYQGILNSFGFIEL